MPVRAKQTAFQYLRFRAVTALFGGLLVLLASGRVSFAQPSPTASDTTVGGVNAGETPYTDEAPPRPPLQMLRQLQLQQYHISSGIFRTPEGNPEYHLSGWGETRRGRSMDSHSTRSLHTGRTMPVMGLGTWELTDDTAGSVEHALRLGYRMIDTAADYGSQPGIGEALRRTEVPREEIFLVAKVEENEDAYAATRRYLGEMDQDYADLMLIHRPPPTGAGSELWEGLARAREDGLARDIGVSNYSTAQIDALVEATGETPVVNQIEWSPFGWSADMLDYGRARDIVIQAYSPLTRTNRLGDPKLAEVAAVYDRTPAQILLRWSLQRGTVPLPKANQRHHQVENLGAFDFELDEAHVDALDGFNEHYSALGPSPQYV